MTKNYKIKSKPSSDAPGSVAEAKWQKSKSKSKVKMGEAVYHLKDIKKNCYSQKEHTFRVMNRENTPWLQTDGLYPSFENRKDTFIQKYQVLLEHQEMLERRISGKAADTTAIKEMNYSRSEQQLKPYYGQIEAEPDSELKAIDEGQSYSRLSRQRKKTNESYIEKINRENKQYQETLK